MQCGCFIAAAKPELQVGLPMACVTNTRNNKNTLDFSRLEPRNNEVDVTCFRASFLLERSSWAHAAWSLGCHPGRMPGPDGCHCVPCSEPTQRQFALSDMGEYLKSPRRGVLSPHHCPASKAREVAGSGSEGKASSKPSCALLALGRTRQPLFLLLYLVWEENTFFCSKITCLALFLM